VSLPTKTFEKLDAIKMDSSPPGMQKGGEKLTFGSGEGNRSAIGTTLFQSFHHLGESEGMQRKSFSNTDVILKFSLLRGE
jgi:hypothetical protein